MNNSTFGKDKKPKAKNEWFQFTTPMVAQDRDVNLLGVAFENPRKGTTGEYTPQGPRDYTEASGSATTPPRTPSPPELESDLYMTPCKWPKDLVSGIKIYPNAPTPVSGVEAIVKKVQDTGLEASIKSALAAALHIDQEQLDTVIIPVLKRYQMESPRGKIRALLNNPDYRSRLIDLLGHQKGKIRKLWIATSVVTCEGVERERVNNDSTGFSGGIQDPTKHVPGKVAANWDRSKNLSSKGKYSESIVLFMAYRRVKYEHVVPDRGGWGLWKSGNVTKDAALEKKAYDFPRGDGSKDRFWIDDEDAEGDYPAFFSPESAEEDPGVFRHGDTVAGADEGEEADEGSGYPDGFFSDSDEEQALPKQSPQE